MKLISKKFPFGNRVLGFCCEEVSISPIELLYYINNIKTRGVSDEEILGELMDYLQGLLTLYTPGSSYDS